MKHIYKKILSFLTIICCVAGSLGTVHASDSESVPRAVFVNEQKDLPDLYIGKTVESLEGYDAPKGDAFTFLLTLDGKAAANRSYVLCDLDGRELTKEQLKALLNLDMEQNTFTTGSNGTFSLQDGFMAKFAGVGAGVEYTVTELPDADGLYEQTFPAGGEPAQGVMEKEGKEIVFVNTYTPVLRDGDTVLEVKKTVAFPGGYEVPETPDFTFCLTVDKTPLGGKAYTVRDDASGRTEGERITGEDGTFTLKGGQTAVFAGGLEAGMDYQVTEQRLPKGWRAVGETEKSGALTAPLTRVTFHNSEASFVVTKKMEDNTRPDKAFIFQLAKEDGALWSGAEYYLYDLRGNLLREDSEAAGTEESAPPDGSESSDPAEEPPAPGEDGSETESGEPGASDEDGSIGEEAAAKRRTGSDGTFTLKPGQAAVFTGLAPGTGYRVNEVGDPDYIQVLPAATEGYTGRTVQESPVEILPFVNKEAPRVPTLAVTKVVENLKGDASDPQDEFHFILSKKEGDVWKPVEKAVCTITVGSSQITKATGPDESKGLAAGEFTLKANETARFTSLLPGEYQVEETGLDTRPEYQFRSAVITQTETAADAEDPSAAAASDDDSITGSDSSGSSTVIPPAAPQSIAAGTLGRSGTTGFVFTNTYQPDKLDLVLIKGNPSGVSLEGAVFRLWKRKTDASGPEDSFDQIKGQSEQIGEHLTTDAQGRLTFEALTAGTYYLEETVPPPGYRTLEAPVRITVTRDTSNEPAVMVTALGTEDTISHRLVSEPGVRDRIELTVTDQYVYELPSTGGPGTSLFYLIGILLLAAAVLCRRVRRPGRE